MKNIFITLCITFFFNVVLAGPVRDEATQTPQIKRLSMQDKHNRIELQRREFANNSPKRLRPIGKALSKVTTTVKQKSRSVSPKKERSKLA